MLMQSLGGWSYLAAFLRLRTACRGVYGKGQGESGNIDNFFRFPEKNFHVTLVFWIFADILS